VPHLELTQRAVLRQEFGDGLAVLGERYDGVVAVARGAGVEDDQVVGPLSVRQEGGDLRLVDHDQRIAGPADEVPAT
jgi:hypothetical protein